jgi:predicted nuclease with TOPRIM domain
VGSLIEELRRREEAARAEADGLRARIEELSGELARAEEQVARLVITREEVTRVLEEPPAVDAVPLEAILTLRAVIANGDFEEYWRYHLAREHQRLYPGASQGQYTLGT